MSGAESLVPAAPSDLAELALVADQLALVGGLADSTIRSYRGRLERFALWARQMNQPGFPVDPIILGIYLAHLRVQGHSMSSIGGYAAALSWLHRKAQHPDPTRTEHVRSIMAELRTVLGVLPASPARALSRSELGAMLGAIPGTSLRDLRDCALLSLGWAAGLRRSEISALDVADLDHDGGDLVVCIRRSKRDQEGRGRFIGIPLATEIELCPVRRLREWLQQAGLTDGPVFVSVDRWGRMGRRLSARAVWTVLRDRAELAGLDRLEELGAHSLRAGLVTELRRAGAHLEDIARHVGHADTRSTAGYVRGIDALRDSPLRLLE